MERELWPQRDLNCRYKWVYSSLQPVGQISVTFSACVNVPVYQLKEKLKEKSMHDHLFIEDISFTESMNIFMVIN